MTTNTHVLVAFTAVWWTANNIFAVDVHYILRKFTASGLFVDLCFVQICTAACISWAVHHIQTARAGGAEIYESVNVEDKKSNGISIQKESETKKSTESAITKALAIAGFFHFTGTVFSNASYKLLGSSSTLVWKLSEPLATVVLKYALLGERTSIMSLSGIVLLMTGVFTFSNKRFTDISLSPVIIANIAYPARNTVIKFDQKHMTTRSSTVLRFLFIQIAALPFAFLTLCAKAVHYGFDSAPYPYLVRNAALFATYQLASLALLELLDALTHSLANTVKRFTAIGVSFVLLKESVSPRQLFGLFLTFIGFPTYVLGGRQFPQTKFSHRITQFSTIVVAVCAVALAVHSSATSSPSPAPPPPRAPAPAAATTRFIACYWAPGVNAAPNFGDHLAGAIARAMAARHNLSIAAVPHYARGATPCLWTVGSVTQFVRGGDLMWGPGAKSTAAAHYHDCPARGSRVFAVRGPLTRRHLLRRCSFSDADVPDVAGDPALLLPVLYPEFARARRTNKLCGVPHFRHTDEFRAMVANSSRARAMTVISPRGPWREVVERIARCEFVVSQSLHGIIVAEALGIGARRVQMQRAFSEGGKYDDYYSSTGRYAVRPLPHLDACVEQGPLKVPDFSRIQRRLMEAFPHQVLRSNGSLSVDGDGR